MAHMARDKEIIFRSLNLSLTPFPAIHPALAFAPDKGEHARLAVFRKLRAVVAGWCR
jgi:hypothetical protein